MPKNVAPRAYACWFNVQLGWRGHATARSEWTWRYHGDPIRVQSQFKYPHLLVIFTKNFSKYALLVSIIMLQPLFSSINSLGAVPTEATPMDDEFLLHTEVKLYKVYKKKQKISQKYSMYSKFWKRALEKGTTFGHFSVSRDLGCVPLERLITGDRLKQIPNFFYPNQ